MSPRRRCSSCARFHMFTTATSIEPAIVGMCVFWMCPSASNRSCWRVSGGIAQYSRLTEDLVCSSLSFSARSFSSWLGSSSRSFWAVFAFCRKFAKTSQTTATTATHETTCHPALHLFMNSCLPQSTDGGAFSPDGSDPRAVDDSFIGSD